LISIDKTKNFSTLKAVMALYESLIIKGVDFLVAFANRQLTLGGRKRKIPQQEFDRILQNHLLGAFRWSKSFQILGMDTPLNTKTESIPLTLGTIPRRFKTSNTKVKRGLDETALLNSAFHYVILGDPGAGKTTTLKRIVNTFASEPVGEMDIYQLPVVVRLRESRHTDSLYHIIAEAVGFPVTVPRLDEGTSRETIWGKDAKTFVFDFLEDSRAVVFLDGLDELAESVRDRMLDDIEELARTVQQTKLIVTCRSGEYRRSIIGLKVVEIEPLTDSQIHDIARHFISKPKMFLKAVKRLPYSDIVDRPLLLTHLLFMYKRNADLPEQPCMLYRKLVRLLLQEWDEQRGVVRKSRYAHFDPDTKFEFLSAFAFHLTYIAKAKYFTTTFLEDCYRQVCLTFRLPPNEAQLVVREIESHTGIIVECGNGFEFSHLSIQEYLTANYIVRAPHNDILKSYLEEYPAPVAVAVTLSSTPSKWLASLLLNKKVSKYFRKHSLDRFIKRLSLETPYFEADRELGYAILRFIQTHKLIIEVVEKIFRLPGTLGSVRIFLSYAPIRLLASGEIVIEPLWSELDERASLSYEPITLPTETLKILCEKYKLNLRIVN
jgi:NACHT domain